MQLFYVYYNSVLTWNTKCKPSVFQDIIMQYTLLKYCCIKKKKKINE